MTQGRAMFESELLRFIEGGRLAADGVPFGILQEVSASMSQGARWAVRWEEISDRFEAHAASSGTASSVTTSEWLWQASLAAHVSQLLHEASLTDIAERAGLVIRLAELSAAWQRTDPSYRAARDV